MSDILRIASSELSSRFFVGTGKFSDKSLIGDVIRASEAQVVTVAVRRVDIESSDENVLSHVPQGTIVMPNTSGARTAEEAVRIARLAQATGNGNWIKVEVIQDNVYLLPDTIETLKATEILAQEGFIVLPYVTPDLSIARRLVDAGAAAVMPLGAPIGSNRGVRTKELIQILVDEISIPIIVDAGIGAPSHAAMCMEMGCDAVLVNTALAAAEDPVMMASAFRDAVRAGRNAYLAGIPSQALRATASSPLTGFLHDAH